MIRTDYDSQLGILYTHFSGEIELEEILEYIQISEFDKENPGDLKILSDFSDAKVLFGYNDLHVIISEVEKTLLTHRKIYDAFIVDNPLETAFSFLYQKMKPVENYVIQIFSKPENGINWLLEI